MLQHLREADQREVEPDLQAKELQRIASLEKEAAKTASMAERASRKIARAATGKPRICLWF